MSKFISFCRKKYKILIPVMVVIVLLVTVYFLYREYKYDNYRNRQEVAVFQYFGGIKNEYSAIVTYNLKDVIIDVSAKDKVIQYDSTPIYYMDEDRIIFPEEMSIVFPLRQGSQYRLYKYSEYELDDNIHRITVNAETLDFDYFFLYDGKQLFFFPYEVDLMINDKLYKKLSPMSYVSVVGGYTLIYYDKESDTSEVIELDGRDVSVVSDDVEINLTEKYFSSFENKVLLLNPSNLDTVFKIVDKK